MKKYLLYHIVLFFPVLSLFYMAGCKKAENVEARPSKPEKIFSAVVKPGSDNTRVKVVHLFKDTVYILSNETFTREAGEQLIIDPGTLIKVDANANSGIVIKPGGIILANGTKPEPVVFTSNNMQGNQNLAWSGITIQGKSSDNIIGQAGDVNDFSGTLNYVRIEFAGLTLTSVGNETSIENVQVSYARSRTSFEINGGSFNARNLISYACGGPADFYITRGYSGKMQNILAYRHPFFGSTGSNPSNALTGVYIENSPNDPAGAKPYTFPVISNLTVLGPNGREGSALSYSDTVGTRSAALITTGNAFFDIRNSVIAGFPGAAWYIDEAATAYNVQHEKSNLTYSIVHSNDAARAFYLLPGAYPPFLNNDFKDFMLASRFNNQQFLDVSSFMFGDPFNYETPDLLPKNNSPVLSGANFDGTAYGDIFFDKVNYIGAIGKDDWMKGWTNFVPLKTNYNFEK